MTSTIKSSIEHWWIFLLRGLLFLLLGMYLVSTPLSGYVALSFLFGVIVLLAGIGELLHAYINRHASGWGWRLFAGIIDLALGIILVTHLIVSMSILPFVLGIWFLFIGFSMLSFAAVLHWSLWVTFGAILTLLFAIVIMLNPAIGAMTIVLWTVVDFIIAGIFNGLLAFRLKSSNHLFKQKQSGYIY